MAVFQSERGNLRGRLNSHVGRMGKSHAQPRKVELFVPDIGRTFKELLAIKINGLIKTDERGIH
jgi:hypothetical protein